MFRTATATPALTSALGVSSDNTWREFDDRDANQDRIASGLAGALAEPGF